VRLSDDGSELIFENGKSIGHRSLVTYYKQNVKPPETRDSVLINSVIQQYRLLGYADDSVKSGRELSTLAYRQLSKKLQHQRTENLYRAKYEKIASYQRMKMGVSHNKLQHHYREQNPL
jgi:pre-60S factor REI1